VITGLRRIPEPREPIHGRERTVIKDCCADLDSNVHDCLINKVLYGIATSCVLGTDYFIAGLGHIRSRGNLGYSSPRTLKLCLVRPGWDFYLPQLGRILLRLIILREAFSDVGRAQAYDRILGGIVVRGASEDFDPDSPFAKRLVGTRKALLHDVAKHVLALTAGSERSAEKNVIQQFPDLRPSRSRNRINRRTVLGGHNGRGRLPVELERSVLCSTLLLEHCAMRFLSLIVIYCQQRASAMFVR
jgi:hypothetical protein